MSSPPRGSLRVVANQEAIERKRIEHLERLVRKLGCFSHDEFVFCLVFFDLQPSRGAMYNTSETARSEMVRQLGSQRTIDQDALLNLVGAYHQNGLNEQVWEWLTHKSKNVGFVESFAVSLETTLRKQWLSSKVLEHFHGEHTQELWRLAIKIELAKRLQGELESLGPKLPPAA